MALLRDLAMIAVLTCAVSVSAYETLNTARECLERIEGVYHTVFRARDNMEALEVKSPDSE
jgi:hypothetical protein